MFWRKQSHDYVIFGSGKAAYKHFLGFKKEYCNLRAVFNPSGNSVFPKSVFLATSFHELDQLDFSFAVIASPNIFHLEQISYLLERGIPFIVEKPIVANSSQLLELNKINGSLSKLCMVGHNLRYQDNTFFLQKWISKKGETPLSIEVNWLRNMNHDSHSWVSDIEKTGGGILIDWGPHAIDLAWHLFPDHVFKKVAYYSDKNSLDQEFVAKFEHLSSCDNICLKTHLSWNSKKKIPLNLKIFYEDCIICWQKNGKVLLSSNNIEKTIFNSDKDKMYQFFLEEFITGRVSFEAREALLNRSIALMEQIFEVYSEVKN